MNSTGALTLVELNRRIAGALSRPDLAEVWVTAEMSDARLSRGHCYMELIDKDADSGEVRARLKGVIWASTFQRVSAEFYAATGQRLASGMKVMVRGSVNFHSAYGMSCVISAIDPSYT
ncbi:MAG: exodeoxyribonuclease VII large subunit, partial [Paramuribaculum sp.]|nr:exodeoxyribonuclease VII large subunit [Paramuribaculum sp.]